MQINKRALFAATLLITAALAITFPLAYQYLHQPAFAASNNSPLTHTVLAIDLNNNQRINQEELAAGKDAILAVKDPKHSGSNPFFNSVEMLLRFDRNKDGRIDHKDAIYANLYLLFLQKHQQKKLIPLAQVGIKAIILHRPSVTARNKEAGYALMKDGTTRTIQLVNVRISQND